MKTQELLEAIRTINKCERMLSTKVDSGIISDDDATRERDMLTRKEKDLIKQLIEQVHIKADGTPRKIEYKENINLWKTLLPDKTSVTGKTIDVVYEKLLEHYGLSVHDYSFKTVYFIALDEKVYVKNKNLDAITQYNSYFRLYITQDLQKKDIRKIDDSYLSKYITDFVNKNAITKKQFMKMKSALNLAFKYAIKNRIITANPLDYVDNSDYDKSIISHKAKSIEKILSENELDLLEQTIDARMKQKKYDGYFINGYAIKFSRLTGVRVAELCSLHWSDIKDNYIHIHRQQLSVDKKLIKDELPLYMQLFHVSETKGKYYYEVDWTKNEKGSSNDGRPYPLNNKIKELLFSLKSLQEKLGIKSDYVFCNRDGDWIKTDAYETCLRRLCQSLGFDVTNNHALRMSLNSNIFIAKLNLPVTKRAELLGHSTEANLKYYTFATKDDNEELLDKFNELYDNNNSSKPLSPNSHLKIVDFGEKKKASVG